MLTIFNHKINTFNDLSLNTNYINYCIYTLKIHLYFPLVIPIFTLTFKLFSIFLFKLYPINPSYLIYLLETCNNIFFNMLDTCDGILFNRLDLFILMVIFLFRGINLTKQSSSIKHNLVRLKTNFFYHI